MSSGKTTGSQHLRPRARILRTFGDELISSEKVALIELVKNSYDADAGLVTIKFEAPLERGEGTIEVSDDGHGMSTQVVQNSWMEPATMHRTREKRSEILGRRVLGEKGVGRFATSRLADRLELVTKRTGESHETFAFFDWTQFDDPEAYLDEVEILWEQRSGDSMSFPVADGAKPSDSRGTVLRMEQLRTDWDRAKLIELRTSLARLLSPFGGDDGKFISALDFEIRLDIPAPNDDLAGAIGPSDMLQNPPYSLRGSIAADGTYELNRRIGPDGEEELIEGQIRPKDRELPVCGPLEIELRVWDRESGSLREVASQYGMTLTDFRRELDDVAGISIYRDGFRVLPYGEPGDDWLGLDLRRVQVPTLRLSNNQIAGYVGIGRDSNPDLRDQTNREGLMRNRAYQDLIDLVLGSLVLVEEPRRKYRRGEREKKEKSENQKQTSSSADVKDPFDAFDLGDLRTAVDASRGDDEALDKVFAEKQESVDSGVGEVRELLGSYSRLASLGRLADAILHDGRSPLGSIDSDATLGLREIERADPDHPIAKKATKRFTRIKDQAGVLSALFNRIAPFAGRPRGRPRKVDLEDLIKETFEVEQPRIAKLGVDVSLPKSNTEVSVEPSDLRIVIWNLLDNALYWLQDVDEETRRIVVRVKRVKDQEVVIVFSDSGPGVSSDVQNTLFEPYVSRKTNGWGIGLAQAGEILQEYYDGALELREKGPLDGATFRVVLRRRI